MTTDKKLFVSLIQRKDSELNESDADTSDTRLLRLGLDPDAGPVKNFIELNRILSEIEEKEQKTKPD